MCTAAEEEGATGGGSVGGSVGGGGVEEIVVTAPRIAGFDTSVLSNIDWAEVGKGALYTGLAGLAASQGNIYAGIAAAAGGAVTSAEAQPDVDLEDVFIIERDMIIPPNTGYIMLY